MSSTASSQHAAGMPQDLLFWQSQLAGGGGLSALAWSRGGSSGRPGPPRGSHGFALAPDAAASVEALAAAEGCAPFHVLLAVFAALLRRHTGQSDLLFGARADPRPSVGPAVLLRVGVADGQSFRGLLRDIRGVAESALAHASLSFEDMLGCLQPDDASRRAAAVPAGFHFGCAAAGQADARFEIALLADPQTYSARIDYPADGFDREGAERVAGHFCRLLRSALDSPDGRILDLEMLASGERRRLLVEWNDTASEYPRDRCVHELFGEIAALFPQRAALRFEGAEFSYRWLDERSSQIAQGLRRLGVALETPVAVACERSVEAIAALLGILKADGAYVGINPAEPVARLQTMLADARCPVLLTQAGLAPRFAGCGARVLALDGDDLFFDREPARPPPPDPGRGSRQLAYVAYTSGSTGLPKGVCVEHRSVVRLVRATQYARFDPEDVFLQFAPLAFDASTFEIWGCLLNGACLSIHPPAAPTLEQLGATLRREGVTTLWLTAGLFHQMVDDQLEALAGVRQVLAGGDALSPRHVRRLLEQPGERWFVNGYGPTENTTFTCCHRISDPGQVGATVSIGRPIANTQVYLVDAAMNPVPVGVAGDLLAGGDGLARGYLNQPERTELGFVGHPFSDEPGARLYRTGDKARYLPDGSLEFLGRGDRQVKVRGFRVELGEIEAVLALHAKVREAVAQALTDEAGGRRIYAYLVLGEPADVEEIRAFLASRLPEYMLPSRIFLLDRLPLNANGKVDLAALPRDAPAAPPARAEPAATDAEKKLAPLWEAVFNRRPVGREEHFFIDLDGDSLQASLLVGRVAASFSVSLSMDILFEAPTIAALAALLDAKSTPRGG